MSVFSWTGKGYYFDKDLAVSEMLVKGVVFLDENEDPEGPVEVWIKCNDLWGWACVDCEPLCSDDIEPLYVAFCCPKPFAFERWAALRFQCLPMQQIIIYMRESGVWDEELEALHTRIAARTQPLK